MIDVARDFFDTGIARDFFFAFCGERLGGGSARVVYACAIDPSLVVKIETASQSFQNAVEWDIWHYWNDCEDVATWLAPCVSISPCGMVLLQKRTTPAAPDELPRKLPRFLTDTKCANYGRFEGRIVCHDYGKVVTNLSTAKRKVEWWGNG